MPNCNNRKNKKDKRKKNNKESYIEGDPMSGRNLLPQYAGNGYDEDEYIMDYIDPCYRDFPVCDNTMPKTPESVSAYGYVTRKNSGKASSKYGTARSRESSLDPDELREKARAKRDFHHRRAKSGQWEPPVNRSLIYAPIPAALFSPTPRRVCTQSAPDLMELLQVSAQSSAATSPDAAPPPPPPRPTPPRGGTMNKSATLGPPRKPGSINALGPRGKRN